MSKVVTSGSLHQQAAQQEQEAMSRRHLRGQVPLPGGVVAPIEDFLGIAGLAVDPGDTDLLSQPERILKKVTPGSRYAWAAREGPLSTRTAGAIRSGRYRPVKKDMVRDDAEGDFSFETHKGTTEYVMWRDCILVEIPEKFARQQYDAPVAKYIRALVADQEAFKGAIERESRGQAVGLDVLQTKQKLDIKESSS